MPFCPACGTENPQQAKFCLACGTALAEAPPPSGEERKVITAIFVDLVGSTARSEQLDPEDVKALVAPYHAQVRAELERHGGTFEKFSGDAVLALFGTPKAHEDDPERAIRAGLAVRSAIADLNAADEWLDLHIRIGIHTGEALVMLGANVAEGEWSAAGDVLNTAARIQSGAPTDGILVGERTYLAAKGLFDFREAEPLEAKGKSEPVPVWEVVAARDGAPARPVVQMPLVGREAELEELSSFCDGVLEERHVGIATILGSPGIGKSRLLLELVRRLEDRCDIHRGKCLSYGEGITYWPVAEIIRGAARIVHDDDAETTAAKLAALLETLGTSDPDELRTIAAAVSNIVGVATTPRGTYSAAEIGRAELHWGLRRLLELRAERRPTVVVVEDLHWAEATLLELLEFIGESSRETPLLVLGTARPEAAETPRPIFTATGRRRVLELDALSGEDSVALIAELVPADLQVPVDRVLEVAGGNPLFLEETVRMLADAGASAEGAELPVPSNLQALIASRLDQLGPNEKRLAQNASVIGTTFWPGAVASMNGIEGDLDEALAELERRDLVRPGDASGMADERAYAFKHALIRDVSYGQVPKGRRAVLHRRFADWVIALPGREEELSEIVAYHLEQACLTVRTVARPPEPPPIDAAIEMLTRAAEKAERREGIREAERFYARALGLLDAESPVGVELRLKQARMLTGLGQFGVAFEQLLSVEAQAAAWGLDAVRCGALMALARIDLHQGRGADCLQRLDEAETLAEEIGDSLLRIRASYELSQARAWFEGSAQEAVAELERALVLAEEFGDRPLRIEGHLRMGTLMFNMGRLVEADEHLERCLELSEAVGSRRDEGRARYLLGFVRFYRGRLTDAERLANAAAALLERTDDRLFQLLNTRALAKYALARGDPLLAQVQLQESLPNALAFGGWLVVEFYRYLAEAYVRQGLLAEAREAAVQARANLPGEDAYASAAVLLSEVMSAEGGDVSLEATRSRVAEAFRLLEEQHLLLDLEEARINVARSLRRLGDVLSSREHLEVAYAALQRIEAAGLLAEVERELAEADGTGDAGPVTSS